MGRSNFCLGECLSALAAQARNSGSETRARARWRPEPEAPANTPASARQRRQDVRGWAGGGTAGSLFQNRASHGASPIQSCEPWGELASSGYVLVGAGDGRTARPAGGDRRGRRERDERPDGQRPEATDADRATDRRERGTERATEPTTESAGERPTTNREDARDKPDDRCYADTAPQHDGPSAATTGRPG